MNQCTAVALRRPWFASSRASHAQRTFAADREPAGGQQQHNCAEHAETQVEGRMALPPAGVTSPPNRWHSPGRCEPSRRSIAGGRVPVRIERLVELRLQASLVLGALDVQSHRQGAQGAIRGGGCAHSEKQSCPRRGAESIERDAKAYHRCIVICASSSAGDQFHVPKTAVAVCAR